MDVYVFGNPTVSNDQAAFEVMNHFKDKLPHIKFLPIDPNADVPFDNLRHVVILDTLIGIKDPTLLNENDIDKLVVNRGATAHDYDLGFQLKYLKKLGKIGSVTLICLPPNQTPNYSLIQSIFKKLVEQDMHGS